MDEEENKLYTTIGSQIKLAADFNVPKDSLFISHIWGSSPYEFESEGIDTVNILGDQRIQFGMSYNYTSAPGPWWYSIHVGFKFVENIGISTKCYSYHDLFMLTGYCEYLIAFENEILSYNPFQFDITLLSEVLDRPINHFPYQLSAEVSSNYDELVDSVYAEYSIFRNDTILVSQHKFPFTDEPLEATVTLDSTNLQIGDLIKFRCVLSDATIFSGKFFDPDSGYFQFRVLPPVTDVEKEVHQENAFKLSNYPNPFNYSTIINYPVLQTSDVVIKVFDMLGNEVETLVNEEKQTGTYEITWYAENLPSGIYFYQLQAGSFVETKKMVLLK
ncbi:MAG: T9SS type A sorting domain-containing protein [Ignavibacteria bacterium]|nr:T9SS type A sorting domain-containing protein [Ignavibacteria bacterium]MBT8391215.1 T9SS type A sorting domain-containing protein [Ignavibacteria bacterium]NNL22442.1 T9SS type A sorting domain-containing protein [Ignavibacteriaceae bacterium]